MSAPVFSVYTPTHRTEFLENTYKSLKNQCFKQWEWVVVPNGPDSALITAKIKQLTNQDPRVRIVQGGNVGSVGRAKYIACLSAHGEYLLELDHDDMLTDDCLIQILYAYERTKAGFFYSDWVSERLDGTFETFPATFGWEEYHVEYKTRKMKAQRSFLVTARTLCEVFWAPNHVRCWRREAYEQSGGYDPLLDVGDDHDLLCRTYLAGVNFHHISRPLYIYKVHTNNTVITKNAQIQQQQTKNRDKYLYDLIFEWCRREKLKCISLETPVPTDKVDFEVLSFDDFKLDGYIWPYSNSSVGCIQAVDQLQYVPQDRVPNMMYSAWLALKHMGWFTVKVPSTDGRAAFQDPSAKSYWNENSFWYYTRADMAKSAYKDMRYIPKFQNVRCYTAYDQEWHKLNHLAYTVANLCANKSYRMPGSMEI